MIVVRLHVRKSNAVILTPETAVTVGVWEFEVFGVSLPLLVLLRWIPRVLKGGPSKRQHLLGVGRKDSEWGRVAGENPDSGISTANVLVFLRLLLAQRTCRVSRRI